jgi:hypothetical protein
MELSIRVFGVLGPGKVYKVQGRNMTELVEAARFEFRQETGDLAHRWQIAEEVSSDEH